MMRRGKKYARPLRPSETKALRREIERRTMESLWGQKCWIKPRLVDEVFGDGKKLLAISPISFRPNYYVVRIDSSWSTSNWERDESKQVPRDYLNRIWDAIEEQFGRCCCEDGSDCDCWFPVVEDFDCGCEWWEMDWPRTRTRRRKETK